MEHGQRVLAQAFGGDGWFSYGRESALPSLGTGTSHLFVRLPSCRESPDVLSSDTS
jgi:hypothetical protein